VGLAFSCTLDAAGMAQCRGRDFHGQVSGTPTTVSFASIAAGRYHVCGLRPDGSVVCWGRDEDSQVSGAPTQRRYLGVAVNWSGRCGIRADDRGVTCWGTNTLTAAPPSVPVTQIAGEGDTVCALDDAGMLRCWGNDFFGVVSGAPSGTWDALDLSARHACAVDRAGSPTCWGSDALGAVSETPADQLLREVATGPQHACGIRRDDDTVLCWGDDESGQGTPPAAVQFASLAAGEGGSSGNTCGIRLADGFVRCWGAIEAPPDVAATTIASGDDFGCGVRRVDGSVFCWGTEPGLLEVPSGPFRQLAATREQACGIRADGGLSCWGDVVVNPR